MSSTDSIDVIDLDDIRAVVAIDFGTTFSGFSVAHVTSQQVETHSNWPSSPGLHVAGQFKVPTILAYDSEWNVTGWGNLSTTERAGVRKKAETIIAEHFKLHLSDSTRSKKHPLPPGLDYKEAIVDFLTKFSQVIENKLTTRWPGLIFPQNVRIVVTVPVEWGPPALQIMRECLFKAGIIETLFAENLEFITEPEAAAIYCLDSIDQYELNIGDSFMIVDCGGGTIDITTRKILSRKSLSEITESTGALCGSSYVDQEFIKYVCDSLEITEELEDIQARHSQKLRSFVQDAFIPLKSGFRDEKDKYRPFYLEIPSFLHDYVEPDKQDEMEEDDWVIELNFDDIKKMFDVAVDQIIQLINDQLNSSSSQCSAMFLVGGFSESSYLQSRIKSRFSTKVRTIAVPQNPITAVCRGATIYGLNIESEPEAGKIIATRILKYTYGIKISPLWVEGDPPERRSALNRISKFKRLVTRGEKVSVDQVFNIVVAPVFAQQTGLNHSVYYTRAEDAVYCDEPGVHHLRSWVVDLPDVHLGLKRSVDFSLKFCSSEVVATSKNLDNGTVYNTAIDLPE